MQLAPISAIANYNGKNQGFRDELVKSEKFDPNGGRSFKEILSDARKKVPKC